MSFGDCMVLLGATVGLGGLVGIGEVLQRMGVDESHTRRVVHAGVGLFVAATPFFFSSPTPVYFLSVFFMGMNGLAKIRHWWPSIHAARPESWGTVTMPMAAILGLAATWSVSPDRVFVFQLAFLILAIGDPVASWVGQYWGERVLLFHASLWGSGTFFCLAGGLSVLGLVGGAGWAFERTIGAALLIAGAGTATEMIGGRGWDNLFVVLAVILVLIPLQATPEATQNLFLASAVGLGFGGAAYVSRTLTPSGAVAGGLFAASLVGFGGWVWALPGFVFFGLSSALSVVGASENDDLHNEQSRRTLTQVFANGGVAWGLLAVFVVLPAEASGGQAACYVGFLGALAAAAADTWATEVGTHFVETPRSLRTGKKVPQGTSGAVSIPGTGAAVLGAASVAGAAWMVGGGMGGVPVGQILVAGLVGMGIDSLTGATLQARFRDPDTGDERERPVPPNAILVRGWQGIDNDVVNVICTGAGAITALLL